MDTARFRSDLVARLRDEKSKKGISCQEIADKTETIGKAISARTVGRVFSPSGCDSRIKIASLLAIAEAMGLDDIYGNSDDKIVAENQILLIKIEEQEKHLREKDERIEAMRAIIKNNEDHIAKQMHYIAQKDRRILILTVACCIMLAVAVLLLGFDIIQPNYGYILGT